MSSRVQPRPTIPVREGAVPWPVVAVLISGIGVFCSGLLAPSVTLLVIGVVLAAGAVASTAMLTRTDRPRLGR